MHIPDGFLDAKTALATGVFSLTGLGASLRSIGRRIQPRKIPLIGLSAAFIFVAQMLNFPVASGTSGHLIGATLAAVLLGPGAAVIVMASVLIVQALVFADGGILALGANAFNMAIVAPLSGFAIYRTLRVVLKGEQGRLVAVGFASWCSTVFAAVFCAGELAWSGTVSWSSAFPAMAGVHMLTGLGEATITMLVISAIARMRPELLDDGAAMPVPESRSTRLVYVALIVIGLLLLIAPHASVLPDGLERVAAMLGFEQQATPEPVVASPLSNYVVPGIHSAAAATIAAGLLGAIAVFALSFLFARFLAPHMRIRTESATPPNQHP